jgi:hypothetical protein
MAMKSYTCKEYRQEMILVGLRKKLSDTQMNPVEKKHLKEEIRRLELEMGMV